MKRYATIIGSREITGQEFLKLQKIAEFLHNNGFILRSGGAEGSDSTIMHLKNIEVFLPWNGFNRLYHNNTTQFVISGKNVQIAKEVIKIIHPAYKRLSQGALKLHCRNVQQIWGQNLEEPVGTSIVVFCAPENEFGEISGGTRTAVEIARRKKIPVYNIRNKEKNTDEMIEEIRNIVKI
jgi:hypothetical protein